MRLDHLLSKENRQIFTDLSGRDTEDLQAEYGTFVVQFSGIRGMVIGKRKSRRPLQDGGVAQLGEHLPCKQGVMGSIPIISTKIMTSDAEHRGHDFDRDFRQSEPTPIPQELERRAEDGS